MREVRLHQALYAREAVDRAVQLYGEFATLERFEDGEHFGVRVSGEDAARERVIAGELSNAVLGLTLEQRGGA